MIQCPKCGEENLINAIFCRSCGARLNLDELEPDTILQEKNAKGKRIAELTGRILGVVLVVGLVVIVGGSFIPVSADASLELSDAQTKALRVKLRRLQRAPGGREFTFDSAEATAIAREIAGLNPDEEGEAEGTIAPRDVQVELRGQDYFKVYVPSRLFGKIPLTLSVLLRVDDAEQGIGVDVMSASSGWIPWPGPLQPFIVERIEPLFRESNTLKALRRRVGTVNIASQTATVAIGK